jgi:lipid-binding SYLF domain-containing protein
MTRYSRRRFLAVAAAPLALAACGNGIGSPGAPRIDARVAQARAFMFQNVAGTRDLAAKSAGMLMMPVVTEAGLMAGGAYGTGALLIDESVVDYYATASASFGLQFGAQQYSHALFFLTPEALAEFRGSTGWVAGADLRYVAAQNGGALTADTTTLLDPVVAVIFGQAGLIAGASVEGQKYTRIIP